jgi:nucleotidyltransferase/DNA polymerase involved in DNA repair
MDAFYAAVEQRDRPELRGRPVVVGADPRGGRGRGVVSTASYEARRFGIGSAMPISQAYRLCPGAVYLPVDMEKYAAVSAEVMAVLRDFTDLVEPLSIDEAFLDVTGSRRALGSGEAIARALKDKLRAATALTASVGLAANKLVAKIASDLRKPDGLVVVPPGSEAAFLAPLPIDRLWGVGAKSAAVLREYGVRTIGDLAALPTDLLERRFGMVGSSLGDRARGLDPGRVVGEREAAKSIGHEHTFDVDSSDPEVIERSLLGLSEGVAGRLRDSGVKASTVTVKIRDSSFHTITRQRTLKEPTDLTEPIFRTALELARPEVRGKKIRLLGVTASGLGEPDQLALFGADDPRRRAAVEAEDLVRHRYGDRAITRARLVRSRLPAPFERDPMTPVDMRAHALDDRAAADGPVPIEPGEEPDPIVDDDVLA